MENTISLIINPVITPGVIAAIFSAVVIILSISNRAAIGKELTQWRTKIFTRVGLFWTVNIVFMAVSVLHAGIFFGITGNGHDLPGVAQYLGFAVSFFLDLVTIILMQAMLESRYRGEENRAKQFLFFIVLCCGTSTFANLAISLNDFDARVMLPHAPIWITVASPYVLASFPLFVIMMSVAAEMIINVRPLESLNEEEYEADEQKRVKILQIRNKYLQKQADEQLKMLTIHAQMRANKRLRKGKMPNSFRWFWEKPVEVDTVIAGVTAQLKAMYEPQIEDLKRRLEEVQTQSTQTPATGITARLTAQRAREPQTNPPDLSWVFMNPNENPVATNTSSSARSKAHDEYGDEIRQNSGATQVTGSLLSLAKNYPRVASEWLATNRKTATLEEIAEVTGHTKRRLNKAPFRRYAKNPDLVLLSSVFEWLRTAPVPASQSPNGETPSVIGEFQQDQDDHAGQAYEVARVSGEFHKEQNGYAGQPKETVNLDEFPELLV